MSKFNCSNTIVLAIFLINSCCALYYKSPFNFKKTTGKIRSNENITLPEAQWYVQRLDHFNDAEIRTWRQRYFVNDTFFQAGGPAFIMIGGEGPADPIWNVEGQWIEWAQPLNAICFQLEHRYYGESHPTPDVSVKNLQYLSSEQALADLAAFRTAMAEQYKLQNATWIVFGGSYAGSLAAWFRLKYPHLADGAVASSAPLRAEVNFKEYLGVVVDSLTTVSKTCVPAIATAVRQIEKLLGESETGWNDIQQKFTLCDKFVGNKTLDIANLFSTLAGNFEGVVQYNDDNREFEGALATNITIETVCGIMDDKSIGSELDRYAAVNSLLLEADNSSCLNYSYHQMIDELRNSSWNSSEVASRSWIYQTCTEFGFFQSSDLEKQPFGNKFPVSFSIQQCADIFGSKFSKRLLEAGVKQTNMIYGGQDIRVTKVVFPNGSIDPWHYLGILKDLSEEAKAVYIQGTAHCADTYPSSPSDPPQLIEARKVIFEEILNWINGATQYNITINQI